MCVLPRSSAGLVARWLRCRIGSRVPFGPRRAPLKKLQLKDRKTTQKPTPKTKNHLLHSAFRPSGSRSGGYALRLHATLVAIPLDCRLCAFGVSFFRLWLGGRVAIRYAPTQPSSPCLRLFDCAPFMRLFGRLRFGGRVANRYAPTQHSSPNLRLSKKTTQRHTKKGRHFYHPL